jgi:cathepsin L
LEGAYQIKTGYLQTFSEQQLVSCDTGNFGCDGGWTGDAFDFVQATSNGICLETDYPYTSGTTGKSSKCTRDCTVAANTAPISVTDVKAGCVNDLMSAVFQQPVSIAIQANHLAFQSYKSGVLTAGCGQRLDHGVLAVGYGSTLNGIDYWRIKNSWGTTWGDDGYILIDRSDANLCGVLDAASYVNL